MLNAAALKIHPRWAREKLYVSNTIKCRPTAGNSNRQPNTQEIATCKRFLDKEIALAKPKLIICVGAVAANTLIHPKFKITEEHGKFFGDSPRLVAIYHPSYILRMGEATPEGITAKKETWEDLININAYLDSLEAKTEILE